MRAIEELLDELGDRNEDVLSLIREAVGLVDYYRRLLERYELDALTGLPGYNKFREFTADIETSAGSVGVIFFDVNGLKYCNDTKGHASGDRLLQKAAESIGWASGKNVRAFRVGGDEFAAIIINCVESDIDEFLVKWREKLEELNATDDDIHCSVAAGAAFGTGQYKFSDLLKLADERMYAEKRKMKESVYE